MYTQRNRIFFFGSTALTGLASLGLHRYMMENCFDHKGLLLAGNLPGTLLWVLGIGYVAALIAMLTTLGGDGSYEDNFPRCRLSGGLMLLAGAVCHPLWPNPQLWRPGQGGGQPQGQPCRGHGQQPQSPAHRHPLPPGGGVGRLTDRLRRRVGTEAGAAGTGGRTVRKIFPMACQVWEKRSILYKVKRQTVRRK